MKLTYFEFLMQCFNVILYSLDELCLILSDGTSNVRSHKQRIEAREDTEHLISILGRSKLVTETCRDTSLNSINPLLVPPDSCLPGLIAFAGNVQTVHFLDVLIGNVDLLKWKLN